MVADSKLTSASAEFFLSRDSRFMTLTFNWGDRVTIGSARERLRLLSSYIDRAYLGKRFYEASVDQRTLFRLTPEKFLSGYPHFHGNIAPPVRIRGDRKNICFDEIIYHAWATIVPGGSVHLAPLYLDGADKYATKETEFNSDDVIWSFDFWSAGARR